VLHVEGRKREMCLQEPTIFAAISCAATDHVPEGRLH
jgi:hypothetical protein